MNIEIVGQKVFVNGELVAYLYPYRHGYCLEILSTDEIVCEEISHSSRDYLLGILLEKLYDV